jgi:TolB-like protein
MVQGKNAKWTFLMDSRKAYSPRAKNYFEEDDMRAAGRSGWHATPIRPGAVAGHRPLIVTQVVLAKSVRRTASVNRIRSVSPHLQAGFSRESSVLNPAAARCQLEKVLASAAFTRADRMSRFLRFIVEETLQGRGAQLKEYLIGLEVFDRKDSYDPRTDPVVRGEARRLRSKLMEYYEEEGRKDPVRIHLPKGNYAAVFEASAAGTADVEAMPLATGPGPAGSRSIAVLPFLNLSPNPENEYFSDGLTEEIIHALGKVTGMSVVARTSVFRYKGKAYDIRKIGEELRVPTILEGSVRKSGERLRITSQLVNATDGYCLWSKTYDRSMVDALAIQEELSSAIVTTLRQYWPGSTELPPLRGASSTLPVYP